MKTLKLVVIGILLLFAGSAKAQISVHVNLGTPPQWGPSGYNDVRYYYLPDVEAYYDIPSSMFIYYNGVSWVHRSSLPGRYRNYDLYNGYKVPMSDYRGSRPYSNFVSIKRYMPKAIGARSNITLATGPNGETSTKKNIRKVIRLKRAAIIMIGVEKKTIKGIDN